jgi:sugar lactone lactonase YvrE
MRLIVLLLTLVIGLPLAAALLPAFGAAELDLPRCQAYADGRVASQATPEALQAAFAGEEGRARWATGEQAGPVCHHRVAFLTPVALGTLFTQFYTGPTQRTLQERRGRYISLLKPDAPYPGDVTNEAHWQVLPAGALKLLPPGTTTRALRFTAHFPGETWGATREFRWSAALAPTLCLAERYYSALSLGHAKISTKANAPESWLGTWRDPLPVAGLLTIDLAPIAVRVEALKATAGFPAPLAPESEWKRFPDVRGGGMRLQAFETPYTTKALRLTGPPLTTRSIYRLVVPLVALGTTADPPSLLPTPPPYRLTYPMPLDGFIALEIREKGSGTLVRRLVTEAARVKGPIEERWDLRDEAGETVPPGDYVWKAIARPPFTLTYELSVNNAGQPAWWAPTPGKGGGGWLADHGAPNCAAAQGNRLWFGSSCSEDGHSAIATDLEGNKLWGTYHLSWGFRGPDRIAVDERCAYLMTDSLIQRVDPTRDYTSRPIFTFAPSKTHPWNGNGADGSTLRGGLAARDGKLYVAVNTTPESWLVSAFPSDLIDPTRCQPVVFLNKGKGHRGGRGEKNYAENEYDELMKLYAAFLTDQMPEKTPSMAGAAIPSSTQAVFGDAPKEGRLANTLIVALKAPVPVGSVLIPDGRMKVFARKPGAPLPSGEAELADVDLGGGGEEDAEDDEDNWIPLQTLGRPGAPAVAVAPPGGVRTQALRYQATRLAYSQVMTHRLEDVAGTAERLFTEGARTPHGGWEATRTGPINAAKPAYLALVWPTPQTVRGLSLTYPKLGTISVELWSGPADADPKSALTTDARWERVALVQQEVKFNGYFFQPPTVRQVDFGRARTIRAVRLRWLAGAGEGGPQQLAGVQGILAYRQLGEDPPGLPEVLTERISILKLPAPDEDKREATVERHLAVPKPNNLAFDAAGTLYCASDGQIVTVPLRPEDTSRVVVSREKIVRPGSLTFDAAGLLYVVDAGPKVIKVFDPKTGALVRTIGTPGGQQLGKWEPARLDNPGQVAVDTLGRTWIADYSYQPKRIMRFAADGTPDKWFLGPTQYGGGGWMDERDRAVLYYHGMKFVVDWATKGWRLDSLVYRPGDPRSLRSPMPDRVVYYQDKRYLIGDYLAPSEVAVICQEQAGVAVPRAAMGKLDGWADVDARPDLLEAFGALDRTRYTFCWWDKSGDGRPQAAEVQLLERGLGMARAGNDLSFVGTGWRLRPMRVGPTGIPEYDVKSLESLAQLPGAGAINRNPWQTADGRIFHIGTRLLAADGKTERWTYPSPFSRHDGFYAAGFGFERPAGVLSQEHKPIGHFTLKNAQGGEEEYFVTNSDPGDWYCYSGDGMLVGCLFGGPAGYALRRWTMPAWEPGKVDLSDVRLPMEHYQGCVVKAEDGKVYAVAGHNHMSIVRIEGLEAVQRLSGPLTVTKSDVEAAQRWAIAKAQIEQVRAEPKVARLPAVPDAMQVNGSLEEWPEELFVSIHEFWQTSLTSRDFIVYAQGALAYDDEHLYIAVRTQDTSPNRNAAQDPKLLFKGGDAADITLGLDPGADPARTAPVPGDLRILLGMIKGKPAAVLYKPVDPTAPADRQALFTSPVGTNRMDRVELLAGADVAIVPAQEPWGAIIEAAIPWTALGVAPPKMGSKLRGDLGILQSDPNGTGTTSRRYWAGKSQTVVCDIPSESRLIPALWGEFYVSEPDKGVKFGPDEPEL